MTAPVAAEVTPRHDRLRPHPCGRRRFCVRDRRRGSCRTCDEAGLSFLKPASDLRSSRAGGRYWVWTS